MRPMQGRTEKFLKVRGGGQKAGCNTWLWKGRKRRIASLPDLLEWCIEQHCRRHISTTTLLKIEACKRMVLKD